MWKPEPRGAPAQRGEGPRRSAGERALREGGPLSSRAQAGQVLPSPTGHVGAQNSRSPAASEASAGTARSAELRSTRGQELPNRLAAQALELLSAGRSDVGDARWTVLVPFSSHPLIFHPAQACCFCWLVSDSLRGCSSVSYSDFFVPVL